MISKRFGPSSTEEAASTRRGAGGSPEAFEGASSGSNLGPGCCFYEFGGSFTTILCMFIL